MPAMPLPDPSLTDGVVLLRGWRGDDDPVKVSWGRDRAIVRWTDVPAGVTADVVRRRAEEGERDRLAGRSLGLAVVDVASQRVVGSCSLWRPEAADDTLAEVGGMLDAASRGRGLAERALRLVLGYGFGELGLEVIQATVDPANRAPGVVLARLGFRRAGTSRSSDPDEDAVRFSVRADELEATPRRER